MVTGTATRLVTRVHTAVHLTNAIAGAIAEILTHLGMSARGLMSVWSSSYEPALRAWIEEGSLRQVVVECVRPSGRVEPIFEFPVEYHDDGAAGLSHRHVALARLWVKERSVPSGTTFRIICQYNWQPSDVHGWVDTTRASTSGMTSVTLGTLAGGPYASASVRVLHEAR